MAQYIGRRIVPVHGGVWDKARDYEELTIVLEVESGNSYISRRPVPAGTVIGDGNYWMLFSLYSQQIADAEKHLADATADVKERITASEKKVEQELDATEQKVEQRTAAAEQVTNSNKAELNARMSQIEARQDANVSASTDVNADYAAEVVDARVDSNGETYASAGLHIRAVEGLISSHMDQIRRSLNWYPRFTYGGINTDTGEETDAHYRVKSEYISTAYVSHVKVMEGFVVIICYYDLEKQFVVGGAWHSFKEVVAIDKSYPCFRLLVGHVESLNEKIEFLDTENIWCYVFNEAENLCVYAEKQASDATDNRIRKLFAKMISTVSYEVSDASNRALSNTARWFIPCRIPEKSYLEMVGVILSHKDSAGIIEVWERSENQASLSLVKTVPFSAMSDEPQNILVDCYLAHGGYASIWTEENAVIDLNDDESHDIPYTKDLESTNIQEASLAHLSGKFNARLYAYQYQFAVTDEPQGLVFTIGEHDNVAEVITEAMKTRGSIVYIEPFTHDCIAEWEDYFGAGYWNTLSSGRGIELCNDIHIIGRSGCLLTCHYTGDNDYVQSDFSLFNNSPQGSGYTIENVDFDVSRIRYVIHDERGGDATPYKVRYSRCRMSQDNSASTWDHSRACIGGGLGLHGDVIVEDCVFNTVTSQANMDSLAYHNSGAANAQNSLVIKNCYCEEDSTLQIASYGASSFQSKILIANNSFGSAIEELHWDGAPGNFDLFYINNEIRSA